MAALVEHSFKRKFLLDEERLRKLREIIASRLAKRSSELKPSFKVFRGDSYSYTTESVDDVVKEDNDDWRTIRRLEILVESKEDLEFRLTFSGTGAEVNIKGEERDEVFLLFSDLREYMNNDVATSRTISRDSIKSIVPFIMFLVFLGFVVSNWYETKLVQEAQYQTAVSSADMHQKLDFIMNQQRRVGSVGWVWMGVMTILLGLLTTGAIEKSAQFLFPSNIFLFGKRKQAFEKKRRLLSNVLWVVLVGLCVSIIAGIIVWYMTGTH